MCRNGGKVVESSAVSAAGSYKDNARRSYGRGGVGVAVAWMTPSFERVIRI